MRLRHESRDVHVRDGETYAPACCRRTSCLALTLSPSTCHACFCAHRMRSHVRMCADKLRCNRKTVRCPQVLTCMIHIRQITACIIAFLSQSHRSELGNVGLGNSPMTASCTHQLPIEQPTHTQDFITHGCMLWFISKQCNPSCTCADVSTYGAPRMLPSRAFVLQHSRHSRCRLAKHSDFLQKKVAAYHSRSNSHQKCSKKKTSMRVHTGSRTRLHTGQRALLT